MHVQYRAEARDVIFKNASWLGLFCRQLPAEITLCFNITTKEYENKKFCVIISMMQNQL